MAGRLTRIGAALGLMLAGLAGSGPAGAAGAGPAPAATAVAGSAGVGSGSAAAGLPTEADVAAAAPAAAPPASVGFTGPAAARPFRPTVTVRVKDLRAEPAGLGEERSCWYRRGLVLGPADVEFRNPELQPLTAGQLAELGYHDSRPELAELLKTVTVYSIPADLDPLQAALNMGNGAAPLLMAGYAFHWGYAPGTAPTDNVQIGGTPMPPADLFADLARPKLLIGAIDTGYVSFPSPPWPTGRVTRPTARDAEPPWIDTQLAGHGMFVAGTILQRRPEANVSVARAGLTPLSAFEPHPASARARFWTDHVHMKAESATDELQMFLAVERLLDQAESSGRSFAALNVSMGAYACDQLSHSGLAIRAAMARWADGQPDAPVVAAAGNHEPHDPVPDADFLPADLDLSLAPLALLPVVSLSDFDLTGLDLTAVAALDRDGRDLADYSNYKPHDVLAVGTDVLSVRDGGSVTDWSGTSFATPVVTGAIAGGELPVGDRYDLGPVRQLP